MLRWTLEWINTGCFIDLDLARPHAFLALFTHARPASPFDSKDATVSALGGEPPACPVSLTRKTPTKPVRAGRQVSTRVKVINTGATPLSGLNVQLGLPSDICAYKTGKETWRGT